VNELANENRIVLISPPPSDPTQPYSSLPALTGFLREKGFDVVQIDLGIKVFDELLSPAKLLEAKSDAIIRMNRDGDLDDEGFSEKYYGIIGHADFIAQHVEDAKSIMRDPIAFYDLKRYNWASSILKMACELISLPCHPTDFKPYDYCTKTNLNFHDLLEATIKKPENLFFSIFETEVVPEILALNPFLVGISVTYSSQIVPSLTLARLLKKASPQIHLCIGGAAVSQFEHQIMKDPDSLLFADSYIIGEGETALFLLANNIITKKDLKSGKNIIVNEAGMPVAGTMWHCEDIKDLPLPDFHGLDLGAYLSPEPVFLIESSRGCYHGRCAFCNVSMNKKRTFRSNARGRTAFLIRELSARYGVERFFLCDDAIPLANMMEIANFVKDEESSITWAGEARLEKNLSESIGFLKQGGCRQLIFGLESMNQRVLDLMDKRNTTENDIEIINSCRDAHLAINLQTFIGFPTETKEEAWRTVEFVLANKDILVSYGFCTFDLCRDTPVFYNPERFGLNILPISDERLLNYSIDFEPSSGMTKDDVEALFKKGQALLEKAFDERANYLCRTAGAHVLLHLSRYDWNELMNDWRKDDEARLSKTTVNSDTVVVVNPLILLSYPFKSNLSVDIRALNTETGRRFSLSSEERCVLEHCIKPIKVQDALELWLVRTNGDLKQRAANFVKGAIIINKLYMNYIILDNSLENSGA
jgi:anaerobic magnesium-protoporphyrin IX monomethyl ester cyclase